jgi:hypothetical protein
MIDDDRNSGEIVVSALLFLAEMKLVEQAESQGTENECTLTSARDGTENLL